MQETFLRAFRSLRTFDTTKPFRNWLLTIALNASRSYLRRRFVTLPWSERYDRAVEPQFASDEGAVLQDVLRAMAQLRYRDREILTLHYVNDLTLKQAANLLGIPLGTAKSRLAKALSRLREALQYDAVFEEKEVPDVPAEKIMRAIRSPGRQRRKWAGSLAAAALAVMLILAAKLGPGALSPPAAPPEAQTV